MNLLDASESITAVEGPELTNSPVLQCYCESDKG